MIPPLAYKIKKPTFYVPANSTDIRATFARVTAKQQKQMNVCKLRNKA